MMSSLLLAATPSANQAPIAIAAFSPSAPILHDPIVLSASPSYDPDDYPAGTLTYSWEYVSGPVSNVAFEDLTGDQMEVSWSPSIHGVYAFELTVDDGQDTDTARFEVTVGNALYLEIPPHVEEDQRSVVPCQLRINQRLQFDLEVFIKASDETEIQVKSAPFVIPAGQKSISFGIRAVDDQEIDGVQHIAITAAADQWIPAESIVSVHDNEGPKIELYGNSNPIDNNAYTALRSNETDYGPSMSNTAYMDHTFSILNAGASALQLTGDPLIAITGEYAKDFEVVQPPSVSTLEVGDEVDFVIRYIPKDEGGTRRATVSIFSNDTTTPEYRFDVKGGTIVVYDAGAAFDASAGGCSLSDNDEDSVNLLFVIAGVLTFIRFRRFQMRPLNLRR